MRTDLMRFSREQFHLKQGIVFRKGQWNIFGQDIILILLFPGRRNLVPFIFGEHTYKNLIMQFILA